MSNIMKATPHSWPQETLEGFPRIIQEFYKDNPGPPNQTEAQLNSAVEDEYKMWTSMSSEQDIFQHFSAPDNSLFLCVIWKILLEKDEIQPIAFKVRYTQNRLGTYFLQISICWISPQCKKKPM